MQPISDKINRQRFISIIGVTVMFQIMLRTLSLFLLIFTTLSGAHAQVEIVQAGNGFDVIRYTVRIRPDLRTTSVSGIETIELKTTIDDLKHLSFSANALQISGATVNGVAVDVTSGKDGIVFLLPLALKKGQRSKLVFQFSGIPARGVKAIAGGIYTSYFACDWMVCLQDTPGDKADLQLDLLLPVGVTSMGVGKASAPKSEPDGLALHRWKTTRPYSPYLFAFAVGPFVRETVRTPVGEMTYLNGTGKDADLSKLFADAPKIAAFFAEKAGLSLPDRRYVQLLVPDNEAQESASFSLIGKNILDDEQENPSSTWVIAHEMAHQYWGNLVTCAT
jgi:aminopeptidase N